MASFRDALSTLSLVQHLKLLVKNHALEELFAELQLLLVFLSLNPAEFLFVEFVVLLSNTIDLFFVA
jgi:hypothetical protein